MRKKSKVEDKHIVSGQVTYSESGQPAADMKVTVMDADRFIDKDLGGSFTDGNGKFHIVYDVAQFRDRFRLTPNIYLIIQDSKGKIITTTENAVVKNAGATQEIFVQLQGKGPEEEKPTIEVGGVRVNRIVFDKLKPEELLAIAEYAIHGHGRKQILKTIQELSQELDPEFLRSQLCFTPLTDFLRETVYVKQWSRDVQHRLEEILTGYDPEAGYISHNCPHFRINYENTGGDQPPSTDSGGNITMPGTGAVVGSTVGGNGIPDYIEKLCFWLENALAIYTSPPFNLRNPASGGRIPVNVTGTAPGSAGGGSMTIGRNLNDDLLAAVPTHELMHLIQDLYATAGTGGGWNPGMKEGGAVLGEDVVFDTHNRYIVQAGSGTLGSPHISLKDDGMRYYLALLLKYISEQQSSQVNPSDEPAVGVDTYRTLLERFDIDSYTDSAFANSINRLPWYQTFYEFSYLDPARLDETSSETSLGNFWVACYLKDLGTRIPDRRFDFMEDEENATWDEIFLGSNTTSTLGGVTLTSTSTLNTGGTITLSSGAGGMVSPLAARFYKVNISSGVDTLKVDFTVGSGFTKPLVQVVLVEQGNRVRDILRTDKTGWSRTIANSRSGTNLDHILVVVAGTDVGGNFTLTVREVPPAPDVMVTRWHHSAGTHYEIDSFGWTWTWVSPDIFVDNDENGLADDQVFFNTNNKLYIRLRNQGHADASNISVSFWYQDASAGLSDSAWQPVKDSGGITRTLTGLTLAAGATDKWYVNWAPAPSGTSHHFCVKAVLTSLGDPNTDNKRCLSNFGNIITGSYFIDLELVLRFPKKFSSHRIDMIPRGDGKWFISAADLAHAEKLNAKAGQEIIEQFRIKRRAKLTVHTEDTKHILKENKLLAKMPCPKLPKRTRLECRPDVFGHYPTNPSALPPGLEKAAMITIAHIVDGRPLGGFTWAFREEKSHGIAKKKIGQGSRRRTDKKANLTHWRIRR